MTASVLLARHERPRWRGRLHWWAFWSAIPAGSALIASAPVGSRPVIAIYAFTMIAGFGTSAAYHRYDWVPRVRQLMQQADHAMIYVTIAGSYLPVCLLAVPEQGGRRLMCIVAVGAVVGVVLKVGFFGRLGSVGHALYLGLGWCLAVVGPTLVEALSATEALLILSSGLVYSLGFPVLVLKRPDPWPKIFGYHEIWHAFTVFAAAAHFVAVGSMTLT